MPCGFQCWASTFVVGEKHYIGLDVAGHFWLAFGLRLAVTDATVVGEPNLLLGQIVKSRISLAREESLDDPKKSQAIRQGQDGKSQNSGQDRDC